MSQKGAIKKQIQVGLLVIVSIILMLIGLSYLKGYSVVSRTTMLTAYFPEVKGLKAGDQVLLKGYQVGQVHRLSFDAQRKQIAVQFWVRNNIKLPKNSYVEIVEKDFLGTMALSIHLGDEKNFLQDGDTIHGTLAAGTFETIKNEIIPVKDQILKLLITIEPAIKGIRQLLGDSAQMTQMRHHIHATTAQLQKLSKQLTQLSQQLQNLLTDFRKDWRTLHPELQATLKNVHHLSDSLKQTLPPLMRSLQATSNQLHLLLDSLNHGSGTASKFLHDPQLYNNLTKSVESLDKLLIELRLHPERFVHFSLFGRKDKEKKKKKHKP